MTQPAPARRSAAQPLVMVIAGLVAVALIVAGVLFVRSQLGEGGEPLGTVVGELVVEVQGADGSAARGSDLDVAREIVVARLDRAGIHPVAVSIADDGVLVRFGEGVDDRALARAQQILARPATIEFRGVLGVDLEVGPDDCAEQGVLSPDETIELCDRERSASYALDAAELEGSSVSSVTVLEPVSGDLAGEDWGVTIALDDEGALAFERLTGRLAAEEGQLALVVANEVVSAPTVLAAITGGDVQISGAFDRDEAEALAAELDLARHGLFFAVSDLRT